MPKSRHKYFYTFGLGIISLTLFYQFANYLYLVFSVITFVVIILHKKYPVFYNLYYKLLGAAFVFWMIIQLFIADDLVFRIVGIFFLLIVFLSTYISVKNLLMKVRIEGKTIILGNKRYSLDEIDSVWYYENTFWLCQTKEDTKVMNDAVHMIGEGKMLTHFKDSKADIRPLLNSWKKQTYKDVTWWTK